MHTRTEIFNVYLAYNNSQDNISLLQPNNPTTAGLEKSNVTEACDKDLKIAFMNMIVTLKEEINKSFKKFMKNKQ